MLPVYSIKFSWLFCHNDNNRNYLFNSYTVLIAFKYCMHYFFFKKALNIKVILNYFTPGWSKTKHWNLLIVKLWFSGSCTLLTLTMWLTAFYCFSIAKSFKVSVVTMISCSQQVPPFVHLHCHGLWKVFWKFKLYFLTGVVSYWRELCFYSRKTFNFLLFSHLKTSTV